MKSVFKFKYAIFKINDKSVIVPDDPIDSKQERHEIYPDDSGELDQWNELKAKLPKDNCRFMLYDFIHKTSKGSQRKIVQFSWIPDTASTVEKELYLANRHFFQKHFPIVLYLARRSYELEYRFVKKHIFLRQVMKLFPLLA